MSPLIEKDKDESEKQPPPMTGKSSDIPVPSLGTPEPLGDIPGAPHTGEISDGPGTRRARGRRTQQQTAPAPAPEVETAVSADATEALAASLANAAMVVFGIVAAMRGEHWQLAEKDAKAIGDSGAICFAPYMADSAKYLPWALFGLNVAGIVMPRLQKDAKKAEAEGRANPATLAVVP